MRYVGSYLDILGSFVRFLSMGIQNPLSKLTKMSAHRLCEVRFLSQLPGRKLPLMLAWYEVVIGLFGHLRMFSKVFEYGESESVVRFGRYGRV